MKRKLGIVCMSLGAVLLLGALGLWLFNRSESDRAGEAAQQVMPLIIQQIQNNQTTTEPSVKPPDTQAPSQPAPTQPGEKDPTQPPEPTLPSEPEMPEVEIEGHGYIGYVSIPKLGLELPVMSDWDYDKLKLSPCRFQGTTYGDDLILMGHNYIRHFGPIRRLTAGDTVTFTDMEGVTHRYQVAALNVLQPTALEELTSGGYDLTLFTCTYGGNTRTVVYCDREPTE